MYDTSIAKLRAKIKSLSSLDVKSEEDKRNLTSLMSDLDTVQRLRMKERLAEQSKAIVEAKAPDSKTKAVLDRATFGQTGCYLYCARQMAQQSVMAIISDGIFNSLMVISGTKNLIICTDIAVNDRLNVVYMLMATALTAEQVLGLLRDVEVVTKAAVVEASPTEAENFEDSLSPKAVNSTNQTQPAPKAKAGRQSPKGSVPSVPNSETGTATGTATTKSSGTTKSSLTLSLAAVESGGEWNSSDSDEDSISSEVRT